MFMDCIARALDGLTGGSENHRFDSLGSAALPLIIDVARGGAHHARDFFAIQRLGKHIVCAPIEHLRPERVVCQP